MKRAEGEEDGDNDNRRGDQMEIRETEDGQKRKIKEMKRTDGDGDNDRRRMCCVIITLHWKSEVTNKSVKEKKSLRRRGEGKKQKGERRNDREENVKAVSVKRTEIISTTK